MLHPPPRCGHPGSGVKGRGSPTGRNLVDRRPVALSELPGENHETLAAQAMAQGAVSLWAREELGRDSWTGSSSGGRRRRHSCEQWAAAMVRGERMGEREVFRPV